MKKQKFDKKELLNITTEECAEVIQAISKVQRFGLDGIHPDKKDGPTNKDHLTEEIGDLLCMIGLTVKELNLSEVEIEKAVQNKLKKLEKWSGYKAND